MVSSYHLRVVGGECAGVCIVAHSRDEQRAATKAGEGVPEVSTDTAVALPDVAAVRHARKLPKEFKVFISSEFPRMVHFPSLHARRMKSSNTHIKSNTLIYHKFPYVKHCP